MKIYSTLILILSLLLSLSACKETTPTDPFQALLANKDWNTDGVYVNVSATPTKTIAPSLKIEFRNTNLGRLLAIGGASVVSTSWQLSSDGKSLEITYPTLTNGTTLAFTKQTAKVTKLDEDELWLTAPDANELKLFGIITITNTMEYRFTTNATTNNTLTNANLAREKGWVATGVYNNLGNKVLDSNIHLTFSDKGLFVPPSGPTLFPQTNLVLVSGIPTSVWGISSATLPMDLTIAVPNGSNFLKFKVETLTSSDLWLTYEGGSSITLFGVVNISTGQQLRLVPKP
jgi:hypothetical protein